MTDGLNVVAVRVEDISAVVVGVVPRSKAGCSVIAAARSQSRGVERIDGRSVWRDERNVHRRRGLTFRDEEVDTPWRAEAYAHAAEAHGALHLGYLDPERCQSGLVEPPACGDVADRDREMVDERHGAPKTVGIPVPIDLTNDLDQDGCYGRSGALPGLSVPASGAAG